MPPTLDFDWEPTRAKPTPPPGHGSSVYRQDTFDRTLRFWSDATKTSAMTLNPAAVYTCQFRAAFLPDATSPSALATLTVTATGPSLATDPFTIRLQLAATSTASLPETGGVWDLQMDDSGVITTLVRGVFAVTDDAAREP